MKDDGDKGLGTRGGKRPLFGLGRKKPASLHAVPDDRGEIDERELEKISGGRLHVPRLPRRRGPAT